MPESDARGVAQETCEMDVLIVRTVSMDRKEKVKRRAQELCENRGGRPGLPVPNKVIVHTVSVS